MAEKVHQCGAAGHRGMPITAETTNEAMYDQGRTDIAAETVQKAIQMIL